MYRIWLAALIIGLVAEAARGELPVGATVLDPDIAWDPICAESSAISPDGKSIAYVSRGAIWVSSVLTGPPTELEDLPDTITAFLASPENKDALEKFGFVAPNPGYEPIPQLRGQILQFFGLQWTPSQDGVNYTVRRRLKENSTWSAYQVTHVSLNGVATEVALIEGDFTVTPDSLTSFRTTRDRKHVIISCFGVPSIWDTATNKPRATCFDYLLPSTTSGRSLGVEIDTRELVLVDEGFRVAKRFGVVLDQRRRCDLFWSPSETIAVCRSYVEHPSSEWEGVRVDLDTNNVRKLAGGYQTDRFLFTARGNEVFRIGRTRTPQGGYADGSNGTFIELIPNGDAPVRDIVRFSRLPQPTDDYRDHRTYPTVVANADSTLFAIALPRKTGERRGYHYHLVDRQGKTWPFEPVIDSSYYSPYLPLAFANDGRTIVARTASQLFSIPVQAIQRNEEITDD